MIDLEAEGVAVQGVLGPLSLYDILFRAKKANRLAPTQVVRADRVVGMDHVRAAWQQARKALEGGTATADKVEVELLCHLAGERQIHDAIEKMGIEDGQSTGAVIATGPKRLDAIALIVEELGLRTDDSVIEASDAKLAAFGITEAMRNATTPGKEMDLVLEQVASVANHS